MSQVDIKLINSKKVCMVNAFCIHNFTNVCFKCNIYTGNINNKRLYKTGNTSQIDNVLLKIYN